MGHLHRENLASARIGCSVRRQKDNLLAGFHNPLLDTTGQDIADTLDLVDSRDGHAHWGAGWSLWHAAHLVKHIVHSIDMDSLLAYLDVHALPPSHVLGLLQKIVSHPTRDRKHWRIL